ncbi:MAG: flagellar hook-basal body complex protein FliE [Candidatus Tectomicrobia bacterium]|uniref:Flagellar hook-basal body complex protein FliE n=1 Tax=Tectimicrobiota bacterium TaxID=2528274 RepID=A0A932CQW1_UNCTE|nr:flagellar hook-basal body complex protein FliE [Candidatus Tectomicrobia bacterium]
MERIGLQGFQGSPGIFAPGGGLESRLSPGGESESFGQLVETILKKVGEGQAEAHQAIEDLSLGKEADLHQALILLEKADLSFRWVAQVRNKLVQAYQEVMRMQV